MTVWSDVPVNSDSNGVMVASLFSPTKYNSNSLELQHTISALVRGAVNGISVAIRRKNTPNTLRLDR